MNTKQNGFPCLSAHFATDEMLSSPLPPNWNGEITFKDASDGGLAIIEIANIAEYAVMKGLTFLAATKVFANFGYPFIKNEISSCVTHFNCY